MPYSYTGIKFPFRFNNAGRVDTSSTGNGSYPHIVESVQQIAGTNKKERYYNPEFGVALKHLVFKPLNTNIIALYESIVLEELIRWDNRVLTVGGAYLNNNEGTFEGYIDVELKDIEKYNAE